MKPEKEEAHYGSEAKAPPPIINKSVTCHFRRQKQNKQITKLFKQRKSRFSKVPKRSLALQVLARTSGSRKFFRIFKRSVFRPILSFFLSCVTFSAEEEERDLKFTWFPISSSLWSCVPARQKNKIKQINKHTNKHHTNKF